MSAAQKLLIAIFAISIACVALYGIAVLGLIAAPALLELGANRGFGLYLAIASSLISLLAIGWSRHRSESRNRPTGRSLDS